MMLVAELAMRTASKKNGGSWMRLQRYALPTRAWYSALPLYAELTLAAVVTNHSAHGVCESDSRTGAQAAFLSRAHSEHKYPAPSRAEQRAFTLFELGVAIVSAPIGPRIDDVRASRPGSRLLRMLDRLTRWRAWLRLTDRSSGVERVDSARDVRSHGGIDLLAWLDASDLQPIRRGGQQGKYVQLRSRYDIRSGC